MRKPKPDAVNPAMMPQFQLGHQWRGVGDPQRYREVKLHSILFDRGDPDQALRVAAGILGKRASGGLWSSGHYCQGCGALPTLHRTWKPQSGVESELGDMVKTN